MRPATKPHPKTTDRFRDHRYEHDQDMGFSIPADRVAISLRGIPTLRLQHEGNPAFGCDSDDDGGPRSACDVYGLYRRWGVEPPHQRHIERDSQCGVERRHWNSACDVHGKQLGEPEDNRVRPKSNRFDQEHLCIYASCSYRCIQWNLRIRHSWGWHSSHAGKRVIVPGAYCFPQRHWRNRLRYCVCEPITPIHSQVHQDWAHADVGYRQRV